VSGRHVGEVKRGRRLLTPLVPVGLTLVTGSLGLVRIGSQPLWNDEPFSWWAARLSFGDLPTLSRTIDPHTALWHVLEGMWIDLYDGGETWIRLLPWAFAVATVPVV
jgi:hypothetical protein